MIRTIKEDIKRYKNPTTGNFEWHEISFIVILIYRIGRFIRSINFYPIRLILNMIYIPFFVFWSLFTGIYIPRGAKIGSGFKIYHFSGIIINPLAIIGKNCTMRQGVTIGNKNELEDVPVIGDNVDFGAGSIVLGSIIIGNNVTIGANAVVIKDVPDNHIAVGVPAKFFPKN